MKNPELMSGLMDFVQDGDSPGGPSLQSLSVKIEDAGGGKFYVLQTDCWAFDKIDELVDLLNQARFAFIKEQQS